jgi:hypothetical protein
VGDGFNVTPSFAVQFCEDCVLGKNSRLPFPTGRRNHETKIGEVVHTDVCTGANENPESTVPSFSRLLFQELGPHIPF